MHEELDKDITVRKNFEKQGFSFADQQLIAILRHYLFDPTDIDKKV
jgi:hypothetical protein